MISEDSEGKFMLFEIFCRRDDEAVFGRCGSGGNKDCGDGGGYVHGIKCCEITV